VQIDRQIIAHSSRGTRIDLGSPHSSPIYWFQNLDTRLQSRAASNEQYRASWGETGTCAVPPEKYVARAIRCRCKNSSLGPRARSARLPSSERHEETPLGLVAIGVSTGWHRTNSATDRAEYFERSLSRKSAIFTWMGLSANLIINLKGLQSTVLNKKFFYWLTTHDASWSFPTLDAKNGLKISCQIRKYGNYTMVEIFYLVCLHKKLWMGSGMQVFPSSCFAAPVFSFGCSANWLLLARVDGDKFISKR